jgi:hypothetical protein
MDFHMHLSFLQVRGQGRNVYAHRPGKSVGIISRSMRRFGEACHLRAASLPGQNGADQITFSPASAETSQRRAIDQTSGRQKAITT